MQNNKKGEFMTAYIIPGDNRDYTDTVEFHKKKQKWEENGIMFLL